MCFSDAVLILSDGGQNNIFNKTEADLLLLILPLTYLVFIAFYLKKMCLLL